MFGYVGVGLGWWVVDLFLGWVFGVFWVLVCELVWGGCCFRWLMVWVGFGFVCLCWVFDIFVVWVVRLVLGVLFYWFLWVDWICVVFVLSLLQCLVVFGVFVVLAVVFGFLVWVWV